MNMRFLALLSLTTLVTACGVLGPPEPPAPIEERATRSTPPTVQSPPRTQPAPTAPAPVARAIPLPDRPVVAPPRAGSGLGTPEPERGFIIETPSEAAPRRALPPGVSLPPGAEPLPPEDPGAALEAQPTVAAPALSPAVQSLVSAADTAAAEQNWDRAQASLERAVKLAPSNSVVWQKLARTQMHSGDLTRAREVAQRALTLAPANSAEQASAWSLIADIEQARGDGAAARAARDSALAIGTGALPDGRQ